jgi:hypothetical protein
VADLLRKEPDIQVQIIDGGRGELTVSVDGREVARKEGDHMPEPQEVLAAVRGGARAGTAAR